jgi:hypothetical protein
MAGGDLPYRDGPHAASRTMRAMALKSSGKRGQRDGEGKRPPTEAALLFTLSFSGEFLLPLRLPAILKVFPAGDCGFQQRASSRGQSSLRARSFFPSGVLFFLLAAAAEPVR